MCSFFAATRLPLPGGDNAEGSGGQFAGGPLLGCRLNGAFKLCSLFGPGFMIPAAYSNYSTGVAAGATYQFRLMFVVLLANIFAIFIQTLCIKPGSVIGLNLAQACRAFLLPWLSYAL
ncbi:metal iron transporter [Geosmithia morbida]|uniref:Metal iron transporter n=1 Tax=Geosmithia morbida TaxID=1094350 RepID=A0A9P5D1U5_9HYPO|nr:metal iron transporter [Geosmithia morbida]KAF4120155.1 metal iron transporter [Geosmithia morbida]